MVISISRRAGFFAELTTTIRHIKKVKEEGKKIYVNWSNKSSLYYDSNYGDNVWENYFKQVDIIENESVDYVLGNYIEMSPYPGMNMRSTFNFIYNKYITLNEQTRELINQNIQIVSKDTLGLHIRKTDKYLSSKFNEPMAHPVDDNLVFDIIDKKLNSYENIFLSTDCEITYDLYKKRYGAILIEVDRIRSKDNKAIHTTNDGNGYQKGLECLIDSYILSNCGFLIRSTSNLSSFSMFMNLNLDCININELFRNDFREHEFNIYSKK
jgi:hypothetical protein